MYSMGTTEVKNETEIKKNCRGGSSSAKYT